MKKLSTTLVLAMSFMLTFGQMQPSTCGVEKVCKGEKVMMQKEITTKSLNQIKKLQQSSAKGNSRWYNFSESVATMNSASFSYSYSYLFPDSSIKVTYSDGMGYPGVHIIAETMDMNSIYWNDENNAPGELLLKSTSAYSIDSVQMLCFYKHTLNESIVDTLEVEFLVNFEDSINVYQFGTESSQAYNVDTLRFIGLSYDYTTNSFNSAKYPTKYTVKLPLTKAIALDTLDNGANLLQIKAPTMPNSTFKIFATSFKFIPGYTYSLDDTLDSKNSLVFIGQEEVAGDYPTSYIKGDWNCSYIVGTGERYNISDGWNGEFIPSFAYTAPYDLEHFMIYYKITGVSDFGYVSVQDLSKNINVAVYPNPSTSNLTIDLNSNETSTVSLYNLVGQNIKQINTKESTLNLNVSDLTAGTYLLKVTQGAKTFTGKVIVQ